VHSNNQHREPATGPTIPLRAPAPQPSRRAAHARPLQAINADRAQGQPAPRSRRASRRPRRSWGSIIRTSALVLFGLLGLGLIASYLQVRGIAEQLVTVDQRPGHFAALPAAPYTLLLIGVDERAGFPEEGIRGDTLIVVRVDPPGRRVGLLSIPRDSLVDIPGFGANKINAAYSLGANNAAELYGPDAGVHDAGMALAAQTVSGFLGIPIDYVAQVNFDGFARVIDALGGVTIDVPARLVDEEYPTEDFGVMRIEFEAGIQKMDGERALIYARTRHADSDFGRSERQQQVIHAMVDELRARGPVGQALLLPALKDSLKGTIATTLPFDRPDALFGLAWLASGLNPDELNRLQLSPETAGLSEDGSSLIWNSDDVRALAQLLLAPPSAESEAARVQVLNGTDIAGLAGKVTADLEQQGFVILPAADAPTSAERTVVYDISGKPATAGRLAAALGAEQRQGAPEGFFGQADIVVVLGANAAQ
jgi:LCP family protein required for cell wall assembly